jgi:radical SAM superfamily enzyme YgiQ (UPF0313 family)
MPADKRLLLVNPWIADFTAYDLWARPMGLLETAGRLRAHRGIALDFLDCLNMAHPSIPEAFRKKRSDGTGKIFGWGIAKPKALQGLRIPRAFIMYGISEEAFAGELERRPRPDTVLMTLGMTYQYPGVQRIIRLIRERWGGVPILLGGIYATLCPEHARRHSGADIVLPGPAGASLEMALKELLGIELHLDGSHLLAYDLLADTSSFPFPTTRGCPYRCTYCASHLLQSRFIRRPVEECLEELKCIRRSFPTRHLAFYDDALLLDADRHAKPLFEGIIRENFGFTFHTPNGLHVREIDAELAWLMRKANVKTIRLSVETTSARLLKQTGSDHKTGDLAKAVEHLENAGYKRSELDSYLLIGIPGQKREEIEESLKNVASLGIRSHFSYFSPIPGTALWKKMAASGLVRDDDDPLLHNKVLFPYRRWSISPEELVQLKELQNSLNGVKPKGLLDDTLGM